MILSFLMKNSLDLINNTEEKYTDALVGKVSEMFDISLGNTQLAIEKFSLGVFGGVINKGSCHDGISLILETINKDVLKDKILIIDSSFDDEKLMEGYLEYGSKILGMLFGRNQSDILDLLISQTGITKVNGEKLFKFLTPIVMNKLVGIIKVEKFNANELSDFLESERNSVYNLLPGLSNIFAKYKVKVQSIPNEFLEGKETTKGRIWWILLLALFIIIILFLFLFYLI